jgi:hypothetical protein
MIFEPPKRNAHCVRRQRERTKKQYDAHDVRNVLFGGAHRALGVLAVQ